MKISSKISDIAITCLLAISVLGIPTIYAATSSNLVAYLGISTSPIPDILGTQLKLPGGVGLTVDYVDPNGPSAELLKQDDILYKFNDQMLVSHQQLAILVRTLPPNEIAKLTVIRDAKQQVINIKLGSKEYSELPKAHQFPGPSFPSMGFGGFDKDDFFKDFDMGWNMDSMIQNFRKHIEEMDSEMFTPDSILKELDKTFKQNKTKSNIQSSSSSCNSSESYTIVNDNTRATLSIINGNNKHFQAIDKNGKKIFDGPVNTQEERKNVPESALKMLKKLEKNTESNQNKSSTSIVS